MASSFKIPKKKRPEDSDSASMHMQSPLSRLQSPAPQFKSYANQSGRGSAGRMHAGNSSGSSAESQSSPLFKKVVKTLLGLNSPHRASTANHRAAGGSNSQSQPGQRGETSARFSNGWRPKRASDRLLQPADTSESPSPPQKKSDLSSSSSFNRISVKSVDSLAELQTQEHAGSLSSVLRRQAESDTGDSPEKKNSSEDDFLSPPRLRIRLSAQKPPHKDLHRPPISLATPDRRRSLDRTAWRNASSNPQDDPGERERKRWSEFRERKRTKTPTVLQNRPKKQERQNPTEPIVLSSEDEEDGEDEGDRVQKTPQRTITGPESCLRNSEKRGETEKVHQPSPFRGDSDGHESPPPSFLQLEFNSLHTGLTHAHANGELLITEHCITIPLTGVEEGEVTVVASQVRGYGVWDGGVVRSGTLLADWKGPAPSLLFLWVTDAQANLLQKELSDIQASNNSTGTQ
ncbi:uncharacterized protein LOC121506299 [Cheilinus undulatus]|uniref:uncharacterized protein LOC121506299 n=1 Tax=Cheilinus undulatus TaxID=241271 RepID=UPI001BD42C20|nr:uncharacterized protein LOC121506299 [Cheilinus undulatus]